MKEKWKVISCEYGIINPTIDDSKGNTIAIVAGCGLESSGAQLLSAINRRAKLIAAAPEMLALLELLAAGYECPPVMSGDNVYDSRDELLRETDHYSCLVDEATQLLAKIEREDA